MFIKDFKRVKPHRASSLPIRAAMTEKVESSKCCKCGKNKRRRSSSSESSGSNSVTPSPLSQAMDKGKRIATKTGGSNFRWTESWSEALINYLVGVALDGRKIDKGFKKPIYEQAADYMNEMFENVGFKANHCYNHYRSLRERWGRIEALKIRLSGNGWNEDLKMIILGEDEAKRIKTETPRDYEFINQPIKFYDEMQMICGDRATGSHARVNRAPIPETEWYDDEDPSQRTASGKRSSESCGMSMSQGTSTKGKKPKPEEYLVQVIAEKLTGIQDALTYTQKSYETNLKELQPALEGLKEYNQFEVSMAYEALSNDPGKMASFLNRSEEMKHIWMRTFLGGFK